jgi:mxaD protein
VAEQEQEITIDRDPDTVWKIAGDFAGAAALFPGVEGVRIEGDTRYISMMGLEVPETLRQRDDSTRSFTYSVGEIPLPMESHEAVVTVHPDGAGSRVTWKVTVLPDDLLPMFTDIYEKCLVALKERCES